MDVVIPNKSYVTNEVSKVDPKAEKAFIDAFEELAPKLYRFCVLRVSSRGLAEDLVSDAFMKTWQYLGRGEEIKSYRVFLYRVLQNLMVDHFRSKKAREVEISEEMEESLSDKRNMFEDVARDIEVKNVLDVLHKLPKSEQEILHWRFVDNIPIKDIAELSGKKRNAVYVSIYRSVQKLKKIFKNHAEFL